MEEDRKVARDSNNDVNRALAACGASPMAYRNFEDFSQVALDPSPAAPSTHEFPLLVEALPEVGQIPVVAIATSAQVIAPVSEDTIPEGPTSGTPISARPVAEDRGSTPAVLRGPAPAQADPEQKRLFAAPRRQPIQRFRSDAPTDRPDLVPPGVTQPSRQALSGVFRTLSAAGPARKERIAPATGLQGIFSRL
jgi:hypothetical protein